MTTLMLHDEVRCHICGVEFLQETGIWPAGYEGLEKCRPCLEELCEGLEKIIQHKRMRLWSEFA